MKYIVKKDYYCSYCKVEFNCDHPNVKYCPRCSTSDLLYKGSEYEIDSNIKYCKCCGNEYQMSEIVEDNGVCDKCFSKTIIEFFKKENNNLTIEEFKEKIKN